MTTTSTSTSRTTIKPTHKPLKTYYATLQNLSTLFVSHELALRTAFQILLESTARPFGWTLVPEQRIKVNSHSVVPDATLRDPFNNRRGFWEAKDTSDDLDAEIEKKIQKKHPLSNTTDTLRGICRRAGIPW
ncbi:MAG: hypothetical protein NTU53_01655 [Planctomycetota bacterium]|nr:hypothetical protein [Planctomycetota bacterium]